MKSDTAIRVQNVSKSFKLPHEKNTSLKSAIINFYKKSKTYEVQTALQDVSFEIKKGEFFGIVGRNGSGKSTLLKVLAQIYSSDTGTVLIDGKLTPFIELGVGFSPELTGRENVYLNGALLGFSRTEMDALYDEIVAFAELERFMDQKLKNYSSGMQVRLAFSIAIQAKTDILLLDEVLAVGDTAFQKKCYNYFLTLKKEKATVVLVTHDMASVERFCDRVLVLDKSVDKGVMLPREAASYYDQVNAESGDSSGKKRTQKKRWGTGKVTIKDINVRSVRKSAESKLTITSGQPLELVLNFNAQVQTPLTVGVAFIDQFGVNLAGPNSLGTKIMSDQTVTYNIDTIPFAAGSYSVLVSIFDKDVVEEYDHYEAAVELTVLAEKQIHGKIDLYGRWEVHK